MKARTTVYLDTQELRALRAEAKAKGISLAEVLQRLVREHLEQRQAAPPALPEAYLKIVALGSSGHQEISEGHDTYLAEALRREHGH